MDLRIDVVGLERWQRRFRGADKIVREELMTAGQKSGLAVERMAKKYAPVWRGHLRRSITTASKPMPIGVMTTVGTSLPYARPVEFGRRAGAPMPPVSAIAEWLRLPGGQTTRGSIDTSLAFVIARAIGRRGIPARPYLGKAFRELMPKIRAEHQQVPRRVIARLKAMG